MVARFSEHFNHHRLKCSCSEHHATFREIPSVFSTVERSIIMPDYQSRKWFVWRMMMPSGKRPPGGTKKSTKWREINDTVFPLLEPWTCIDQASEDWHRRLFLPTRCGKARGLNGFPDYRHLIISLFLMSFQLLPRKAQKYRRCSWV